MIFRRHLRHSTPIYPPSLSFSEDCALLSVTAVAQAFRLQSLPHSFHRDGGCTPQLRLSSIFRTFFQVPYAATPLFVTLTKTTGGVPTILNSELPANHSSLITRDCTQVFSYHTLAHSFAIFALTQNSTLLFSNTSALFARKQGGGGVISVRLAEEGPAGGLAFDTLEREG